MDTSHFVIVGGGLAGSLMAVTLAKKGHTIDLYEKRPDMRKEVVDGGRSINLALSHRGILSLEQVGLMEEIRPLLIPMKGRMIHPEKGELTLQPYGKDDSEVINSVSRVDLNKILLNHAEDHPNVSLHFNHTCESYDNRDNTLTISTPEGNLLELHPDAIIAADGANSAVRTSMLKMGRFDYSQEFMDYGYKELEIPKGEDGNFQIEPNALHIWPRKEGDTSFVMIALANPDKSFTLTLFAPFKGTASFERLQDELQIKNFFSRHFSDVVDKMPTLVEDFQTNPTGNLVTIKCYPWHKGNAVLIGDAAHAIIPFYGQGMNAAFEDVRVLGEMIDGAEDWKSILNEFSKKRKPSGDAIASLSYDNFLEMRDGVADDKFLERKAIELELYDTYDDIISKYASVTFHPELTYYEAKQNGKILEEEIKKAQKEFGKITDEHLEIIRNRIIEKRNQ